MCLHKDGLVLPLRLLVAKKKAYPLTGMFSYGAGRAIVLFLFSLVAGAVQSAELIRTEAARANGTYRVSMEIRVAASVARVQRWLTDYEALGRLNSGILESVVLERRSDHEATVRIVTRACFAFYCVTTTQVQEFVEKRGELHATILPEQSDFAAGSVKWCFLPEGEFTRVRLDVELSPNFWIPPMLGPYLIKREVRKQALETLESIERLEPHENRS